MKLQPSEQEVSSDISDQYVTADLANAMVSLIVRTLGFESQSLKPKYVR